MNFFPEKVLLKIMNLMKILIGPINLGERVKKKKRKKKAIINQKLMMFGKKSPFRLKTLQG